MKTLALLIILVLVILMTSGIASANIIASPELRLSLNHTISTLHSNES